MKTFKVLCLGLTAAALLVGCGGGGGGGGGSHAVFGITDTNHLVKFELNSPNSIDLDVAITGLQGGESILGIDFRDATGQLYGIGSTSRLYIINTVTGAATQVGTGTFSTPLSGNFFGMDFNDGVDRIRIVSDTEQNYRLNPNDASVAGVDTAINPAGNLVAAAYFPPVGTVTTLFAIDSASDTLVRIGSIGGTPISPNSGQVTSVGALGVAVSNATGFDIDDDNEAIMSTNIAAGTTNVYSVDLATGSATFIGLVGNSFNLMGIAVQN